MQSAEALAVEQATTMTELGFGPGEGVVTPYELPDIEQILVRNGSNGAGVVTARELENIHKQAYAEGFETGTSEGYADGQRRAAADIDARCQTLDAITRQLAQPLATRDEELETWVPGRVTCDTRARVEDARSDDNRPDSVGDADDRSR